MDTKDWLVVWSNAIATVALIHTIRKDKTAPRKPRKHRKKR